MPLLGYSEDTSLYYLFNEIQKIKYGNIKRKLIEELKIDLNKLIEALKIYIWKNLLKK